jgi:hypothetical protein
VAPPESYGVGTAAPVRVSDVPPPADGWHHGSVTDDEIEGTLATEEPAAEFDPSTIRDPLPQPLFSLRRLVIVAVLALAVLCLYVAGRSGGDTDPVVDGATAIASYQPTPGGRVLRQSEVGVVLEEGYDGRITIDGVAIPEEQMVGAVDPESTEYQQLSDEQRDLGPRPNKKNVVKYQPGPGKAVSEYATGSVEITIRYWRIADGPDTATTTTYTVRVF